VACHGVSERIQNKKYSFLRMHWELHTVSESTESFDLLLFSRFLIAEIVGGKTNDHKTTVPVLGIELLQIFILIGVAAAACRIDYQNNFIFVSLTEVQLFFTVEVSGGIRDSITANLRAGLIGRFSSGCQPRRCQHHHTRYNSAQFQEVIGKQTNAPV